MHLPFLLSEIFIFIIKLLLLSRLQKGHAQDYEQYSKCLETKFECGQDFVNIGYPFWGINRPSYCGLEGFELTCDKDENYPMIKIESLTFRVVSINQSDHDIWITRSTGAEDGPDLCPPVVGSSISSRTRFGSSPNSISVYVYYDCPDSINFSNLTGSLVRGDFKCMNEGVSSNGFYVAAESFSESQVQVFKLCKIQLVAPVLRKAFDEFRNSTTMSLVEVLRQGFTLNYIIDEVACSGCVNSSGLCGSLNSDSKRFQCLCRDGAYPFSCPKHGKTSNFGLKFIVGTGCAAGVGILLFVFIIYYCLKKTKLGLSLISRNVHSYPNDVEAFIRQYGSSIPKRFKYASLKSIITSSFKDELGKGGYGNVYKGRLGDGRVVAVKVLNATKGKGEDFINEVASIGRTSHVNIVNLFGFCYEGEKRALIYEFMPNGSLEKFIYGTTPLLGGQHLGWEKLYSIALGIARGLDYLHQGCTTRIVHFDIKPHNILLNEDFCPKISDFGLAKSYTTRKNVVSSLLQARGTIGYIAPELTNRNFGQVSLKCDVYSYGMMILEMVGGRKNVDAGVDHTSQIYYPRWLYKRIQLDDGLNTGSEISKEENELVRKMVIIGLWCIQVYPTQRPSMGKVIEMLEGQISALEMPPSPYLCSDPNSPSNSQRKLVYCSPSRTESTSSA